MLVLSIVIFYLYIPFSYPALALNSFVGSFLIDDTPDEKTLTTKIVKTTTVFPNIANNSVLQNDKLLQNRFVDMTNLTNVKVLSSRETSTLILSEIVANYMDANQKHIPSPPPVHPSLHQSLKGHVVPALYMLTTPSPEPAFVQYELDDDVPMGGWRRRLKNDVIVAKKLNATRNQFVSGPNNDTNTHPTDVRDKRNLAVFTTQIGYSNSEVCVFPFM
jgi:hypothetical protein